MKIARCDRCRVEAEMPDAHLPDSRVFAPALVPDMYFHPPKDWMRIRGRDLCKSCVESFLDYAAPAPSEGPYR